MIKKSNFIFAALFFFALAVVAKVFGPYMVAAAGPKWANYTLDQDSWNEYEAAQQLAQKYLAPAMIDLKKRASILKSGIFRVVYYDGQIADFRIERWPSALPLTFSGTVASSYAPHVIMADAADTFCNTGSTQIQTGYWGSDAWLDSSMNWVVVGGWVDTGTITFSARNINCR